jgi:hypothetical protein
MAPKNVKVEIGVSVSNASNGKLEIKIKPWRIHIAAADTVEWVPVVHNTDDIVSWFRIDTVAHTPPWPFPDAPPDAAYTGNHAKHAKTPHGRTAGLPVGSVIPYSVAIAFTDDDGNERFAEVDPDMVMD